MTPPPGMTQARWVRMLAMCRQMDDRYNRAENVGKPRLTCPNDTEHMCDRGTLASENKTGPGAASTASRPLATGPVEETR